MNPYRKSRLMSLRPAWMAAGALVIRLLSADPTTTFAATDLGLWTPLPALPSAHQGHTATLMLDGKVFVAGGLVSHPTFLTSEFSSDAALYRPATDDWLPVPSMATARGFHGAALAGNGNVVIAGGQVAPGRLTVYLGGDCGDAGLLDPTADVELFDPATLTWTSGPAMSEARADFSLVRLFDGRVLAAGGADSTRAEIYDPTTDSWSSAGTMHSSRAGAAYALMPDGRVMVAGGNYGAFFPFCDSTAEIYDPGNNTWTATDPMSLDRRSATATVIRLPDGSRRVLVAGGFDNRSAPRDIKATAELYDPATNKWTPTGSMTTARAGHTATLLRDGRVLVTGGFNSSEDLSSAEVYDPATGTWMALNSMASARSRHTATLLATPVITEVAIVGGSGGTTSAELFQPTPIASRTFLDASGACQPITLTASSTSTTGRGVPTGTVTFKDGGTTLGMAALDQFGQASLALGALPDGGHGFSAVYSGDDAFDASQGTLSQQLSTPPTVAISGTFPARALGTSVTLPVTVSGGSAPYSFAWRRNGSSVSGGASLTDIPALGVNSYQVTVTDAAGCASLPAVKQIDVFDFSLAMSPSSLTLLRGGVAQNANASVTLASGSSTTGLPATVTVGSIGAPADLGGLSGTLSLPQTAGATLSGQLSLQPGAISLGDFAVSVTASAGGGTRSALFNLHVFDFGLSISPADRTGYRSGFPITFTITSAVTSGSTAVLPGALSLATIGLPPDASYTLPPVAISGSIMLSLQPGPTSSGTFPFTVTGSSGLGDRSATATLNLLVDATPPLIGLTVNGTAGANGWYVSTVTVDWTLTDAETPVTSSTGCATGTVSSDTAGMTFTCSATSAGGTTSRSVTVKRDVTPPLLSLPGPVTVNANQPAGVVVTYVATAADNVDPSPSLTCTPASGTLFPSGQTIVTCQATNAAGLSTSGSFTVTVLSPSQQVGTLIGAVNSLPSPPGSSLNAKLQQILAAINSGDTSGACADLAAFINEVEAQRGKKISTTDADGLIQAAETIRKALGC